MPIRRWMRLPCRAIQPLTPLLLLQGPAKMPCSVVLQMVHGALRVRQCAAQDRLPVSRTSVVGNSEGVGLVVAGFEPVTYLPLGKVSQSSVLCR